MRFCTLAAKVLFIIVAQLSLLTVAADASQSRSGDDLLSNYLGNANKYDDFYGMDDVVSTLANSGRNFGSQFRVANGYPHDEDGDIPSASVLARAYVWMNKQKRDYIIGAYQNLWSFMNKNNMTDDEVIDFAVAVYQKYFATTQRSGTSDQRPLQNSNQTNCDGIYVGKVVEAPTKGVLGAGLERAAVLGFSTSTGMATVKSLYNPNMIGEVPCWSLK